MTTTLSPAGQFTAAAIARRDQAQAQAAEARRQAQAAHSAAATLQTRLHAGDWSVSVEDVVSAGPAADRLDALAAAHDATLPGFEAAIRQARTDEVIERVQSGEILSREDYSAKVADLVRQVVDVLEPLELALEPVAEQHRANAAALPDTTAYGSRSTYRNGSPYSPIRIGPDDLSFDVEGTTYVMDVRPGSVIDRVLADAGRELMARRAARVSA